MKEPRLEEGNKLSHNGSERRDEMDAGKDVSSDESDSSLIERLDKWDEENFIKRFNSIQHRVHISALSKGWWKDYNLIWDTLNKALPDNKELRQALRLAWLMSKLNLVSSEIGESTEGLRTGELPDDKIPQYSSTVAELADVIIRIMDLAGHESWPLAEAIIAKIKYNATRPYKHNKLA